MPHDKTLKDAMVSAFEHLKAQDALLSAVIADVAALREALCEKSPEILVRHEELLAQKMAEPTPRIASSALLFDEIIHLLRGSTGWTN
jgi:hypothetical protein